MSPHESPLAAQPYLSFEGRCEEALAFYKETLGAEVTMLLRFGEMPPGEEGCAGGPATPPPAEKVMHAAFRIGASELYASDGMCQGPARFCGIALSVAFPDAPSAQAAFNRLADGGRVDVPMMPTFFTPAFGIASDRFGVQWMVLVAAE
jgi:PhnB protein